MTDNGKVTAAIVGSGNISVTSNGGDIALNATHGGGTAIRTTGTVSLSAAASGHVITENSARS